jgi:hypothetical protein
MESLRLQVAMDRRSTLMSTLSNSMRKMSENSAGLIANLKQVGSLAGPSMEKTGKDL